MGDYTRFDDEDIHITPPLSWGQIQGTKFLDNNRDAKLVVEEIRKETDTGTFHEKSCMFIVPAPGSGGRSYYDLENEIREIVEAFPEHKFSGLLKGITEGFDTDDALWGILVKDNVVTRIKPELVWPGEEK